LQSFQADTISAPNTQKDQLERSVL